MIFADISGCTKFMVENQLAAVYGQQQCITFLIETILYDRRTSPGAGESLSSKV
jgi:hypothetical protein